MALETVGSKVVPGFVTLPSATACASVLFSDFTVSVPFVMPVPLPAVMVKPPGIEARAVVFATVMPTAPATSTFFELPSSPLASADEPSVLPADLPPLAVARSEANCLLSAAFLLTPPFGSFLSLSFESPPATLDLALDFVPDAVLALKATAPLATTSRAVVAIAESVVMASAKEMPTPVLPDSVLPVAETLLLPSCEAVTFSEPALSALVAASALAFVVLLATEMATTGVTAVLSLFAAPSASLSIAFFEAALIVTAPAPETEAALAGASVASPSSALVSVSPMFRLNTGPTPVEPPFVCLPVPLEVTSMKFSALISTVPLPVTVTVVPSAMYALVWLMPTLMTSAPATLVAPPLAPAIAATPSRLSAAVKTRLNVSVVEVPPSVNEPIGLEPSAFDESLTVPSSCSTA